MNYEMQMLEIRSYSVMKLGWIRILISENLSQGLQESKKTPKKLHRREVKRREEQKDYKKKAMICTNNYLDLKITVTKPGIKQNQNNLSKQSLL